MKMEIIGPLILSLLSGLSTVIGSIFIFFKIRKVGEFIVFSLSLSMGIMIIVSLFDLIPQSIPILIKEYGLLLGSILSIITFILGYISIKQINNKINIKTNSNSSLHKIGILSMISLMLHNFPEGIAVFMSSYTNISIGIKLCIAIILHNIPEGIAISVPLFYGGESRGNVVKKTLLSGMSEPLGALLSFIFLKNFISDILSSFILIFVSGLMISLSLNDILKEILKYENSKYLLYGVFVSIILFTILNIIK